MCVWVGGWGGGGGRLHPLCARAPPAPRVAALHPRRAERTAWAAAEEHGLDLVTVLPEFVMGPLIAGRTDATSMGYFKVGLWVGRWWCGPGLENVGGGR